MRIAACIAAVLGTSLAFGAEPRTQTADVVLFNGKVLSVDANDTVYEALAIRGERILAVGSNRDISSLAGARTRRIDLKGRAVTPGLLDTHLHLGSGTSEVYSINLGYPNVRNMADVVRLVKERVEKAEKGEWIRGGGWDEGKLEEKRYIYARDLDPVSPDNPVVLTHTMGHYLVANSAALRAAGITRDTADPPGGTIDRGPDGEPTGILKERANGLVTSLIPNYTAQQLEDAMAQVAKRASSECLTGIKDPGIRPPQWEAYQRLRDTGKLPLRVATLWFTPTDLDEARALIERIKPISRPGVPGGGDGHLVSIGVKIGLDGSGGARTAWMHEDWSKDYHGLDTDNKGYSTIGVATASSLVRLYHEAGIHMGIHSIGDKAIDWTVNAFEQLLREKPTRGLRHSIIHANVPTDAAIDKMAKLQKQYDAGYPESQAPFLWWLGDTYSGNLGPLRSLRLKPFRTYLEKGVIWANGSDYFVTPFEPRYGLWATVARETLLGVNGPTPFGTSESVDIRTALRSYTAWAARQMFMEQDIGTIEPGKLADLAVWDKDPYTIPTAELKGMKCTMTFFNGKVVHQ